MVVGGTVSFRRKSWNCHRSPAKILHRATPWAPTFVAGILLIRCDEQAEASAL